MHIGYIRTSKSGPSAAQQREALLSSGVIDDHNIYIDEIPKRRKGAVTIDDLAMRAEVIRCIRDGDAVVVSSLDRLGLMTADILTAVEAICRKGGVVIDASVNETYRWHPEAVPLVAAAARAERALMSEKMVKARAAKDKLGVKGGRPPVDKDKLEKARTMWGNPEFSVAAIAKLVGLASRTLYQHLGPRSII